MATEYSEVSAYAILQEQSGRTDDDISPVLDIGADALAQLHSQYHCSPHVQSLLLALVDPLQEVEDTAYQLLTEVWSLDLAVGAQLDIIGELVDEAREGRPDDAYRASLRVRVLVNDSNGKTEELIHIVSVWDPSAGPVRVELYGTKSLIVTPEIRPLLPSELVARLREAKESGANIWLVFPVVDLDNSFAFAADYLTPGTSTAQGLGDTYGPTIGGALAAVL